MENNDFLRRIRYTFDFSDQDMIKLFDLAGYKANRAQVSNWLKREEDPDYKNMPDIHLAYFLNGLIIQNRGAREGPPPVPEHSMNNNLLFKKMRIALNMKDEDILDVFDAVDVRISKHELSAFFRNPNHPKYRFCNDQYLRKFMRGVQLIYRTK